MKQFEISKKDKEEYIEMANSPDLSIDKIGVYLSLGIRTPKNKKEEEMLKEIEKIKKNGGIVEFPFD